MEEENRETQGNTEKGEKRKEIENARIHIDSLCRSLFHCLCLSLAMIMFLCASVYFFVRACLFIIN